MADFFLLHGDNYPLSRQRLTDLIAEFNSRGVAEKLRLDGKKIELGEIKQALEAHSLFGGRKLVILEGLLGSPKSRRKEEILEYLLENKYDSSLILWERKEIEGKLLNKFRSKFKIEIFKIPAVIFKFLDSLLPGNHQQMISWLHKIDPKEPEMIFYMLCQRIRQLIIAKDLGQESLGKLAGWQQTRLLNQAKNFELNQLLMFYQRLLEIDYQQKTGQTPFSLSSTLDLLLANL